MEKSGIVIKLPYLLKCIFSVLKVPFLFEYIMLQLDLLIINRKCEIIKCKLQICIRENVEVFIKFQSVFAHVGA